ncbi:hypothetical protein [Pectinatus sottacetonis]|uniref:hypothetical protein n=1 Tax=Pectinatus sottacetonis TaxID=1002795 RepID=UPI0018C78393|nr:hypothetical protein [Pectinatus sottacetonis]
MIQITYFVPNIKKSGGEYVTNIGYVKKIKKYEHLIVMFDGITVFIANITNIQSNFYKKV